ncbi:glucan endo-1,3-alpha-glucosidase agn1 precursor, putative [Aspergillus oryzae 100-8]|uniref:Glycoside hydrolase family 71 n=2 Tax=Aspergillus oryzae TaxID=5062 RepID=A0A1S9DNC5_ASPOZ|nr:glucan endo-1,3-alpha-glucosidase agn1 precursor, putative [Aspergillus oryzae 3.042]KDE78151.1 glucan endo-1,3-alpha-glucosidase agn1 precursor, putative [Aspergillus oryzae 100-8]OOO10568.1 Glycoside hydrolase family 71 [Aspergillus oryzae]|eukprot:EIT73370.1 glucan endo-1,3-alpha-glucosidase agn1 precursor, putative [Aspergillus oryzae 3.042]
MKIKPFVLGIASVLSSLVDALPSAGNDTSQPQASDRMVFAHFMIGIVSNRKSAADFDSDMKRAKELGIDAFALNIGVDRVDPFTDTQLEFAYQSAANNDMKVFISFDFNWWKEDSEASQVGQKIAKFGGKPAQLMMDGKIFVSSFAGDRVDVNAIRSAAGRPIYWAPNYHRPESADISKVDALLNWMAWPNDGNNKAPKPGRLVTVQDGDKKYMNALGGKPYIAPVSPWFSTHFGPEVPYSKNWVFPSDNLWYERWVEMLNLKPRFIEIVTWNDYGESHYIAPLASPHTDDGCSKYVNDMPHNGWMELARPFIAAYKAGASSVNEYIKEEQLIYWYRPSPRGANCDATDTCMVPADNSSGNYFMGRPNGWESMDDVVFVVSMLKSPANIQISSGNSQQVFEAKAGATAFKAPMGVGKQSFAVVRDNKMVLAGTSPKDIIEGCVCGIYNFNAFVGMLPPEPLDPLQPDSLSRFAQGLKVQCEAKPSLKPPPPPPSTINPNPPTNPPTNSPPTNNPPPPTNNPPPPSTTQNPPPQPPPTNNPPPPNQPPPNQPPGTVCTGGTGENNYKGLCHFCCHFGYCPPGPCTCNAYGAPIPAPPSTGQRGVPADGMDDSYKGLCSFACDHGYCPQGACKLV